jgi:plasmid stabilization system protein ParE
LPKHTRRENNRETLWEHFHRPVGKKAGKHIIFYRKVEGGVVEIVRILHETHGFEKTYQRIIAHRTNH